MKNKIHHQLVLLAESILKADSLSAKEIKDKAQQLYEQSILLAYAEKNKDSITALSIEDNIENEISTKTETKDLAIENAKSDILNKEPEITPSFEIKEGVLGMTFESASKFSEFEKKQDSKVIHKEELVEKKEEDIEEENYPEAPALLHELENLTQGFDLPDFEPVDEVAIENQVEDEVVVSEEKKSSTTSKSLNDTLTKGFNVGLNDRIAFTNQLFAGDQQDYTRVISQLNTTETLEEAIQFINDIVKPEYNNWDGKETFELRFIELIERNFQS